jgi:uncharacterized glyoxalase superfamily protein PhnB
MSQIQFQAIPTFRITDYKEAIEFYTVFLGFSIDWEHRFAPADPVYMQISRDGLVLHLSENVRFPAGSIVFVQTTRIEAFHMQFKNMQQAKYAVPELQQTAWGTQQIEITDPFNNLLRFNQAGN